LGSEPVVWLARMDAEYVSLRAALPSAAPRGAIETRVAFSPDGASLLTGASDQTARVWNVQTGVEVRRLTTPATEVKDVSFSPDGTHILTAGGDATTRLWPTDYHDTIGYLCGVLTRDLTADERAQYGIADEGPTCGGQ